MCCVPKKMPSTTWMNVCTMYVNLWEVMWCFLHWQTNGTSERGRGGNGTRLYWLILYCAPIFLLISDSVRGTEYILQRVCSLVRRIRISFSLEQISKYGEYGSVVGHGSTKLVIDFNSEKLIWSSHGISSSSTLWVTIWEMNRSILRYVLVCHGTFLAATWIDEPLQNRRRHIHVHFTCI